MAQSKAKFDKVPEVDFKLSSTGITIMCPRFYTPRFMPFDIVGRCNVCKSDNAEIDFLITIDGITIYCNRLKQPKFIQYDYKYESFPQFCLFRVKTKGKVFNIQHANGNERTKGAEKGIIDDIFNYDLYDETEKKAHDEQAGEKPIEDMPTYF